MLHSHSAREYHLTAFWSDHPDEDQVVVIDWTAVLTGGDPTFHEHSIEHMEEIMIEEAKSDGQISVITLSNGTMFQTRPLYERIKFSKMERAMKDGAE